MTWYTTGFCTLDHRQARRGEKFMARSLSLGITPVPLEFEPRSGEGRIARGVSPGNGARKNETAPEGGESGMTESSSHSR